MEIIKRVFSNTRVILTIDMSINEYKDFQLYSLNKLLEQSERDTKCFLKDLDKFDLKG